MKQLARIEVGDRDGAVVVGIEGDIDLSNAHEVRSALESATGPDATGLVVDLSQVGYLDSSGVAVLVGVARDLGVRRQRLVVVAPADSAVRRVLEIVQIDQAAGLHAALPEALRALEAPWSA